MIIRLLLTILMTCLLMSCTDVAMHVGTDTVPKSEQKLPIYEGQIPKFRFDIKTINYAISNKKILVIYYHSSACHWCNKMDKVWDNKDIKFMLNNVFVFVDVNIDDDENRNMYVEHLSMFEAMPGIPLTVFVFPGLDKEQNVDQSLFEPITDETLKDFFSRVIYVSVSGYEDTETINMLLSKFGRIYKETFYNFK